MVKAISERKGDNKPRDTKRKFTGKKFTPKTFDRKPRDSSPKESSEATEQPSVPKISPEEQRAQTISNALKRINTTKSASVKKEKKEERDENSDRIARTIFIGNVPINATEKDIKDFLKISKKEYESIYFRSFAVDPKWLKDKRISAIKKEFNQDLRANKNCYVVYREEAKEKMGEALDKNMTELLGNTVRVDKDGEKNNNFSKFDRKRTVFVGGLPHAITENEITEHFTEAGEVKGVRIIRDNTLGVCKGFGFVMFAERGDVIKAIQLFNQTDFAKNTITVKRAESEEDLKKEKDKKEAPMRTNNAILNRFNRKKHETSVRKENFKRKREGQREGGERREKRQGGERREVAGRKERREGGENVRKESVKRKFAKKE